MSTLLQRPRGGRPGGQDRLFDPRRRERAADHRHAAAVEAPRPRPDGGRLTLEQRLDGVWEGLLAAGTAECPVCRGRMVHSAGAVAACDRCGAELS